MVRHQDVSVVRIDYVPLVRLCNVFCNSQIKHPITSLWYVSTTSQSYVVARPCLQYRLYYVLYFKLLCHDLHLVGFQVSFKHQTPHFSSTNQVGNKRSSLDYNLVELLLHLKTASYINNICNNSCVDI